MLFMVKLYVTKEFIHIHSLLAWHDHGSAQMNIDMIIVLTYVTKRSESSYLVRGWISLYDTRLWEGKDSLDRVLCVCVRVCVASRFSRAVFKSEVCVLKGQRCVCSNITKWVWHYRVSNAMFLDSELCKWSDGVIIAIATQSFGLEVQCCHTVPVYSTGGRESA